MAIKDAFLGEWDHEMAGTRTVLAMVPDDKHDWAPHPKSFTAAKLGTHVAIARLTGTSEAIAQRRAEVYADLGRGFVRR